MMKIFNGRWAVFGLTIFAGSMTAFAQLPAVSPQPGENEGVVGPQLIAWSALQSPQPIPVYGSEQNRISPLSAQKQAPQQPEPETQQTVSQSVTGTVSKIGGQYVLQTDDNVNYQLDAPANVEQYVGKHVKITGTLDRSTNILRVRSIELLS